ncbi:MAG: ABC transporter ATP-binding protein [Chloroflexi bacterium]|nr:ABC transporter ATP-binding protein [Chloroflexota bacterium]
MTRNTIINVDNLSKKFSKDLKRSLWYGVQDFTSELIPWQRAGGSKLRPKEFWALNGISFDLHSGEALGVIGPNGGGKSTLLKLLYGLVKPDQGRITINGRVGALIELGAGFNPILTGRENVQVNAALLGLTKKQVNARMDEIIEFSGIRDFIDTPVQYYSSGMWVRLGFAIASHIKPDILLVDEILAVGDMAFQRKSLQHMHQYLHDGGSLVIVSHNMFLLQAICNRCLLLDQGQVTYAGATVDVVNKYFERNQDKEKDTPRLRMGNQPNDDNPVIIDKVAITPSQGEEIYSGQSMTVMLNYNALKEINDVYWGFSIWTGDQWVRIASGYSGYPNGSHKVTEGKGRLRCTIPNLPLVAGQYALRGIIGDGKTKMPLVLFGWEDAAEFFTVKSVASELDNLYRLSGNLVNLEVEWDT